MAGGRRLGTSAGYGRYFDFSRGVMNGASDFQATVKHMHMIDNLLLRPERAFTVRGGARQIQNTVLASEPTTIGKLVPFAQSNQLLVHRKTGVGAGAVSSIIPGTSAPVAQAAPGGYTVTDKDWDMERLNHALFTTQRGDTQLPLMFQAYNIAAVWTYTLDPMKLAVPTVAPPNPTASALTGGVNPGYHWWRIRYRYRNGASKAGPAFPAGGLNVVAASEKVSFTNLVTSNNTIHNRQDWVGWTLERTKLNAPYTGTLGVNAVPAANAAWYRVDVGTTETFDDVRFDADLWDLVDVDEGSYGDPIHFDGLVGHMDRLWGWVGGTLYASQLIGDAFGTGLCNWDPELSVQIGENDGESIQLAISAGARLIVIKTNSVWSLDGTDPDSWLVRRVASGFGASGPRAACELGGGVYGWGNNGPWMMPINGSPRSLGRTQIGAYLKRMNTGATQMAQIVLAPFSHPIEGNHVLLCYPGSSTLATSNDEQLLYDIERGRFTHMKGWRVRDALVQKDDAGDFSSYQLLFLDPAALIGGSWSVWGAFVGTRDFVRYDGTGGNAIRLTAQTPMIDDGLPDTVKDLEEIELHFSGDAASLVATIEIETGKPGEANLVVSVPVEISDHGNVWAAEDGSPPVTGELVWASDDGSVGNEWGGEELTRVRAPLPIGTQGIRYSVTLTGDVPGELAYYGFVMDGDVMPERTFT